jgi:hypothetical protein
MTIGGEKTFTSNLEVGTAKLFVNTQTGNVGIGTTTPATYLHLSAKNSDPLETEGDNIGAHTLTEYLRFTSTFDSGDVNGVSVGFKLGAGDNSAVVPHGRLDICANNTGNPGNGYGYIPDKTIATFLGSGNVGIGTTAPAYKLDVHGTSNVGALTATSVSGDGSGLTTLNASNVSSGTLGAARIPTTLNATSINAEPAHDDSFNYSDIPFGVHYNSTVTSNTTLNDPKSVMILTREGTAGEAYAAGAAFQLSRWENNGTNSRSRLDIALKDGNFDLTTVMTMRSTGNVGIGTTSPAQKLDVAGRIRGDTMEMDSYIYHVGDTNTYLGFPANDTFTITTSNAERLRVDSSGNVGLGLTNPSKMLHVKGEVVVGTSADNYQTQLGSLYFIRGAGRNTTGLSDRHHYISTRTEGVAVGSSGNNMIFHIDDGSTADGSSHVTPLTLRGDGRVGIGTTDPAYTLDVHGTSNVGALTATSGSFSGDVNTGALTVDGNIDFTPIYGGQGNTNKSGMIIFNKPAAESIDTSANIDSIYFDDSDNAYHFTKDAGKYATGNAKLVFGSATVSGTVTASAFSGNASTATKLATARTIGGVSFDGSANIDLPGVNTQGSQSTTGNAATATKLATARTIGGVSFDGSAAIDLPGVNTQGSQSTTGNASTATKLATARTIGGVSFDGSAAINLPGVNTQGSQSTTGNAATATKLATARTIGGVSFDGSANIDLPGVNTQGSQSTTGNAATATKLATARTIGGVSFDGSAAINLPGVNTQGSQSTTGNAATATKLATARTIGGVSFDGSANIDLPGVNTQGSQSTTGNAATATTAGTATNQSGGTVSATTGTFSGDLTLGEAVVTPTFTEYPPGNMTNYTTTLNGGAYIASHSSEYRHQL